MDDPTQKINKICKNDKMENKIGDYIIKHTIGKGTFGKVKIGEHIPTKENIAIKILEKNKITDKDDMIRIEREMKISKSLNHLNIVKIFEIIEDPEKYYIIMEHAKGGELFNYILNKRRLSEQESSFFFYQIINGMEKMHKLNIVHRDLKPENLLLTEEKIIKIIDFGLSNEFAAGSLLQTPCGSPCYAAPEMVLGKRYSGVKIDIWSCGIILYAMTCGYLPFEDKKNEVLFRKIIDCDYEFPGFLSGNVKDLIKKLLVTNPRNRADIEDIKKHNFYKQGKALFCKEKRFCFFETAIMQGNKEIERIINKRLVLEFNEKLKEKLTFDEIEKIKNRDFNNSFCNKIINNENDLSNYLNEDPLQEEENLNFKKFKKYNEESKKMHNKSAGSESEDETNFFTKSKNKKNNLSKFNVSYEILYNHVLKDKEFLKELISKLPAGAIENTNVDRETRRSKSINNHQFCFGQPEINININCVKKIENLNINIAPMVSVSSVPYSSKEAKQKEKNKCVNFNANRKNNYNTIVNSKEVKSNPSKFKSNNNNYRKNLSLNNNDNNINYDLSINNNNCDNINTINIDNFVSNAIINNINTNVSNILGNNSISTRNNLQKQKTLWEKRNPKNIENNNNYTIEAKSLHNQFEDCKSNFFNKSNNKHVNTLKKTTNMEFIHQFSTNNTKDPNINPYVNSAKENYSIKKNASLNQKLIQNSARINDTNYKNNNKNADEMNLNLNSTTLNEKNLKAFCILNKNRNESLRLGTPKKTDLANYLINKGNTKNNNLFSKSINNSNNRTIDLSGDYKTLILNKKENTNHNKNNKKLSEIIKMSNTISSIYKNSHAAKQIEKKIINKTSDLANANKEKIDIIIDYDDNKNAEEENLKLLNNKSTKCEINSKKSERLKISEIKRFNSTQKQSQNMDINKHYNNPSKSKNVLASSDKIFPEYSSKSKKLKYHTNSFNISYYNSKDFSTLILKSSNDNNYLSSTFKKETNNIHNKNNNKTIQSEIELKASEITKDDSKIKRLRRLIKDSLGSSTCAVDLSSLQRVDSPKATNADTIISSYNNNNNNYNNNNKKKFISKNNGSNNNNELKMSLRQSKTICTEDLKRNNFAENVKGNMSSRVTENKKIASAYADWRPLSKPNRLKNKSLQLTNIFESNILVKEINSKAGGILKEFESCYNKVSEDKNKNWTSANKNGNYNTNNTNNNNNFIRRNVNTIDIDLNDIKPRASIKKTSDKYSKLNSKINKETISNKYVTLDLFEFPESKKEISQVNKTIKHSSKSKYSQNSFKSAVGKDSISFNENKINDHNFHYGYGNNFIKFSLYASSVSKPKINLSPVPLLKK